MEERKNQQKIGRYTLIKSIGKGGMGQVYLAYDPVCERNVALKCIRDDLTEKKAIRSRFLKEARIASKLTHPSILPIYAIHSDDEHLYYTMSYVEGETLREILKKTKDQERKGLKLHPIGGSIGALSRIFLNVCEAIAYAHSHHILHRDIKPENIIIGKFGEVMILDWGIAEQYDPKNPPPKSDKVAGTVAYMAPERGKGEPASFSTEIYSLGVILYQILTLDLPFHRGNLEGFRKTMKDEILTDPIEMAPYREIPRELVDIVKKCLAPTPEERYHSAAELIEDIKNTIEGKPDWIFAADLFIDRKSDWEFQENICLTKHTAITRNIDQMQWVGLMVSSETFSGNIRMEAKVKFDESGSGLGFLLGIPEMKDRTNLEEGYCLWIQAKPHSAIQLFRSGVMVIDMVQPTINTGSFHDIKIEKAHDHVRLFLDDEMIFTYTSHLPLTGAHVGLLHKDMQFEMKDLKVLTGSHNVMVNCLAVPDAFFAHKDFDIALTEYRRIGRSFPGRAEGRDAIFKAGMTLIEQAKRLKNRERKKCLDLALDEFENLHLSPGAPLEYLGKALVYRELHDHEEEAKCLEYALRKYRKHPLIPVLEEHILCRMHESAGKKRDIAYRFIFLVVRYFPKRLHEKDTKDLIESLQKNWEELYFIQKPRADWATNLSIVLAFWIGKKKGLSEIIFSLTRTKTYEMINLENALLCLIELGAYPDAKEHITKLELDNLELIKCALLMPDSALRKLFEQTSRTLHQKEISILIHILKKMLIRREYDKISRVYDYVLKYTIDPKLKKYLDAIFIWNFLFLNDLQHVKKLFSSYDGKTIKDENGPLFSPFLAYCYLADGKEALKKNTDVLPKTNPTTSSLLVHYLQGNINLKEGWIKSAFDYEKEALFFQLTCFYRAIGKEEEALNFEGKLDARYTRTSRKKHGP